MLKEKILILFVLCSALFLFNSNDCSAQGKKDTIIGYAYISPEGSLDHATLVAAPDNLKQVLYLGEINELSADLAECFKTALEHEFEVVITGNIGTYNNGSKYLVRDQKVTCTHRN